MPPHRVAVLLIDGVLPIDFAIPVHILWEAGDFYRVRTASLTGAPVALVTGNLLSPDGDIRELLDADTIIVPSYDGAADRSLDPQISETLRSAAGRGTRIASICSGAFALAQAGLLTGLTVTTHWAVARRLARANPDVTVDAAALIIDNGAILTSGGVTAGVDLVLHMVRQDLGQSLADYIARRIVMMPRTGSQAQFSEAPGAVADDEIISSAQRLMLQKLGEPLSIDEIARRANLSVRQFSRRFVDATGQTPLAWRQEERLGRAKELLESTSMTIDEISRSAGLGTPANLRAHFRKATGMPPAAYRRAFRTASALGVGA